MTTNLAIEGAVSTLPKAWRLVSFRRVAQLTEMRNSHREHDLLSLASTGIIAPRSEFDGLGRQAPSEETIANYWITHPGDLVVNPMWLIGGGIGVSEIKGAVSPDYRVYRLSADIYPRYLNHLLRSSPYRDQYRLYIRAETTFDRRISKSDFHQLPIALPPLEEQRRIADFLDAETARIDRLSTLQRKVLKKIDERETAMLDLAIDELIDRAGTRPLRRHIWAVDQGTSPQCDAVPAEEGEWGVLKVSCLRPGEFFPEENKLLPDGTLPEVRSEVREGDLLITRANTPQLVGSTAVVGRVRSRLLLSDKIFRVRLEETILPEFVAVVARGSRIRALCSSGSNGASQSMANIRFEEVKAWPMPAADLSEQVEFVNRIRENRASVERLRPLIKRQLELLAERRQALITAAVTGRFDVSSASGRGVEA